MGAQAAGQGSTRHLYERYPHPCVFSATRARTPRKLAPGPFLCVARVKPESMGKRKEQDRYLTALIALLANFQPRWQLVLNLYAQTAHPALTPSN